MRRHARSENRTIVRKLCDPGKAAEIGSRVFPFRSLPASMPSVGTRRSTRVFVAKAAAGSLRDGVARPLRSARRLAVPKKRADGEGDEWMRMFGGAGDAMWWKGEGEGEKGGLTLGVSWDEPVASEPDPSSTKEQPEPVGQEEPADSLRDHMFGIIYSRKRRRSRSDDTASSSSSKDWKYGIIYSRKRPRKKPKVTPSAESSVEEDSRERMIVDREHEGAVRVIGDGGLEIPESARNFAEMAGISGGDLSTGLGGPMALFVLIEYFSGGGGGGSFRFSRILISILSWMRNSRASLWDFIALLFSGSLAGVFSLHGIHFLPIRRPKASALSANAIAGCGLCKIYGARQFVPLLSLDFHALPLYFKSLHVTMVLGSQYLPGVLARYLMDSLAAQSEEHNSHAPAEAGYSGTLVAVSVIPATKRKGSPSIAEATEPVARSAVIVHGSRLQKHQRKRSSLGQPRTHSTPVLDSQNGVSPADHKTLVVSLPASLCSVRNSLVEPVRVKTLDTCVGDLFSIREEDDAFSPLRFRQKHRKLSRKSPGEGIKELKSALAEVKQNIDSIQCNANILATDSDRCWREEGAEVMLEFSSSKEWFIAVKAQGTIRYLHKPQDMRPCVVNRFTHAYMWTGEDGWKLEFCDKWDWHVFKELHIECRERNTQDVPVKIIPVPGVREVSGYDEIATSSFTRDDIYIHMMDDEVGRALASEIAHYDMDSGDDEWLRQRNSRSFGAENNDLRHISEDIFEKIVFALEKNAYNHPDDIYDKERAIDLCRDLGRRDLVATVFDYWLKKRNKRRAALVKVFQGPPLRRAQLIQKPFLRKKRSFTRQRSQTGRGKQESFLQTGAKQEAMRRVQEAEGAANRAVESAIRLRSRAQMFMSNAELATYRSLMALQIAEAKRASGSTDLASDIVD